MKLLRDTNEVFILGYSWSQMLVHSINFILCKCSELFITGHLYQFFLIFFEIKILCCWCCCCCCCVASVVSDSVGPHRWQPTSLPRPWDSPDKNTGVGCHFLLQCMKMKSENEVAQSCPTLSDLMDCSLPGSSIHEIFQARVLEWIAIAFSEKYSNIV